MELFDCYGAKVYLYTGKSKKVEYGEIVFGRYDHVLELQFATGACQLIPTLIWNALKGSDNGFNPFAFEVRDQVGHLPITEAIAKRQVTLPLYPQMDQGSVKFVSEALLSALAVAS
jgi:hypothetical protein